MNRIRIIEGTTLASIGLFCASAALSLVLQSSNLFAAHASNVAMTELPAITIVGKRLNAAEKIESLRAEQQATAKSMIVERKNQAAHAG